MGWKRLLSACAAGGLLSAGMLADGDKRGSANATPPPPPAEDPAKAFTVVPAAECELDPAEKAFQRSIREAGGTLDIAIIDGGVVHIATCRTPEGARAVQEAFRTIDAEIKRISRKESLRLCMDGVEWVTLYSQGKFDTEVLPFAKGAIWIATSDDPAVVRKIQALTMPQMMSLKKEKAKAQREAGGKPK